VPHDVAEGDDPVHLLGLDGAEHLGQGLEIGVDVRNDGEAHRPPGPLTLHDLADPRASLLWGLACASSSPAPWPTTTSSPSRASSGSTSFPTGCTGSR